MTAALRAVQYCSSIIIINPQRVDDYQLDYKNEGTTHTMHACRSASCASCSYSTVVWYSTSTTTTTTTTIPILACSYSTARSVRLQVLSQRKADRNAAYSFIVWHWISTVFREKNAESCAVAPWLDPPLLCHGLKLHHDMWLATWAEKKGTNSATWHLWFPPQWHWEIHFNTWQAMFTWWNVSEMIQFTSLSFLLFLFSEQRVTFWSRNITLEAHANNDSHLAIVSLTFIFSSVWSSQQKNRVDSNSKAWHRQWKHTSVDHWWSIWSLSWNCW